MVKLKSSLLKFEGRRHDLVNRHGTSVTSDHGYAPFFLFTFRSFPNAWLISEFVTKVTRRVSLVEQVLFSGADPGFQVRGGALIKIAPSGGGRENFWGISCEKSRFYAKKSYPPLITPDHYIYKP